MWLCDVLVESDVQRGNPISTTGGHVWDAARRLTSFIEASEEELGLRRGGFKILELGAGCGYLGMTVARNIPSAHVCLTEMEYGGALEHLQYNVDLNRNRIPLDNVTVAACDWSLWNKDTKGPNDENEAPHEELSLDTGGQYLLETEWDLIIGSDLVYNEIGIRMLPRVMRGLAGTNTVILYCHTKHRFDMYDQDFLANIVACGLRFEETVETGQPMPPPSPPLFESLFPEMRIAVWKITSPDGRSSREGDPDTFAAKQTFVRATYLPREDDESVMSDVAKDNNKHTDSR